MICLKEILPGTCQRFYTLTSLKYMASEKVAVMKRKGKLGPDWDKFHRWEEKYEIAKLRKLEPMERVRILDDLYRSVLKIRHSLKKMDSQ